MIPCIDSSPYEEREGGYRGDTSIRENKKLKLDATESSELLTEIKPFEELFNQNYVQPPFISAFRTAFRKQLPFSDASATISNKPFPTAILSNIFPTQFLESVRSALEKETFYHKSNDLYEFYQSDDLKLSTRPELVKLRESIYSPQFVRLISELTGIKLDDTPDLSAHQYSYGNYLLCHDDDIKDDDNLHGRRVAFIFYLVEESWSEEDGGALHDEFGQPNKIVRSIIPKWNSMAFFELSPTSYHQVSEVLSRSKVRLSVSGWFHGSLRTRLSNADYNSPTLFTPRLDQPFHHQYSSISDFVNPSYLTEQGKKSILKTLRQEASIELHQFLKEEVYEKLMDSLDHVEWKENPVGPPFIRKYHLMDNERCTTSPPFYKFIHDFLTSTAFTAFLSEITRYDVTSLSSEIRQFLPGDYTVLHDQALDREGLDIVLYCIEEKNKETGEAEEWNVGWQGGTHYVTREEELLTLWPKRNTLSIVVRDEGTMRFVKYTNNSAKYPRREMAFIYVDDEEGDEEGDGSSVENESEDNDEAEDV
ncbi:11180_t:CDS:2 [Acaulospora colombiana]|uniref:11180_t:CDS:1 n=1 Tax=Acaulospora colombiana TaxID=27376 RepID=A0ACA9K1V4_9GLOM|nr:11180_t:CDS:2 [Acaulospora colombiana]